MDCKLPKSLTMFFVANCTIFLYLFSDFYRKAYKNNKVCEDTNVLENNILLNSEVKNLEKSKVE